MIATTAVLTDEATTSETHQGASPPKRGGGPRTPEGKERSRRNALKHGLRSKILLPQDLAAKVAERTEQFLAEFRPANEHERCLVGEMALASVRLDRCVELSMADLQRRVEQAELCWDPERRLAAEKLGATLAKKPSLVARALRTSRHGAEWLLERWEALGNVLEREGTWNDTQRTLAHDLLGDPIELRSGSRHLPPNADPSTLAALVASQVEPLKERLETALEPIDAFERESAASGLPLHEDALSARLRRYESECRRAFQWAYHQFRRLRPAAPQAAAPAAPPSPPPSAPPPQIPTPPPGRSLASWLPAMLDELEPLSEVTDALTPLPDAAPATAALPVTAAPARPRSRKERKARLKRAMELINKRAGQAPR